MRADLTAWMTLALGVCLSASGYAQSGMIDGGILTVAGCTSSACDAPACAASFGDGWCNCSRCRTSPSRGGHYADDDYEWLGDVKVGYDGGFVIASRREQNVGVSRYPFRMLINGWGQLRHTITNYSPRKWPPG